MVLASTGPPNDNHLGRDGSDRLRGRAIPLLERARRAHLWPESLASSHRTMLKRCTKIILILMSLMRDLRDLLWETVAEPVFWPVMLVLAGTFAYLLTSWRARCVGTGRTFEASGEVISMSRSGVMFLTREIWS